MHNVETRFCQRQFDHKVLLLRRCGEQCAKWKHNSLLAKALGKSGKASPSLKKINIFFSSSLNTEIYQDEMLQPVTNVHFYSLGPCAVIQNKAQLSLWEKASRIRERTWVSCMQACSGNYFGVAVHATQPQMLVKKNKKLLRSSICVQAGD